MRRGFFMVGTLNLQLRETASAMVMHSFAFHLFFNILATQWLNLPVQYL